MREHARLGTETLDGLRGLAILLVLCYHSWLFSWYTPQLTFFGHAIPADVLARTGYLGVDLFFVISGFVLFFPYAERTFHGCRTPSLSDFAFRRFIKIVPSYGIVLLATIPAVLALPPAHTAAQIAGTFVQHAAFVQNFFDDGFGQANSVFWSLAVEVQFYLIFPIVAVGFARRPLAVTAAMTLAALAYRYATAACCLEVQTIARQMPAYADVFAAGMLAAHAVVRLRARVARSERFRLAATAAAIAFGCIAFALLSSANGVQYDPGGRERWDVVNRTCLAFVAAGAIVASCFAYAWWRAVVANRALVFLSIVSYNLYLWHTLVMIWMWKHGVPAAATADPHADDHWKAVYLALGWAASIGFATAITFFIERPLLGFVKPQPFAFDWPALARRLRFKRARAIAPERRT